MNLVDIATSSVQLIIPYLSKAGLKIAEKAGEAVWKLTENIYNTIRNKFKADNDSSAEKILLDLEESPESETHQVELINKIVEKAKSDSIFATQLMNLVQETTKGQDMNQFVTQVYGSAIVGKVINISQAGSVHID